MGNRLPDCKKFFPDSRAAFLMMHKGRAAGTFFAGRSVGHLKYTEINILSASSVRRVCGYITVVQEQRFQLQADGGQGLLLTLAHNANADAAALRAFCAAHTYVEVEYDGTPELASGAARSVRALE